MKPAARVTDQHTCPSTQGCIHTGGPIIPEASPTIEITGQPAARLGDRLRCACAIDAIRQGSDSVEFNGRPAARVDDRCVEGVITTGEPTVLIGGAPGKMALSDILKNYQVKEDKMTTWPSAPLSLFTKPVAVTETEAKMLNDLVLWSDAGGPWAMRDMRDQAFAVSTAEVPTPSPLPSNAPTTDTAMWIQNDGHRDAFRHAYWNTLMTQKYGEEWTRQFTTAHEGGPGNPAAREAMDLYNNEVGRQIAAHNPGATPAQLAALVKKALDDGDVVVIDKSGNLQWSNTVPLWQHGLTAPTTAPGVQPVPAGDVYAK